MTIWQKILLCYLILINITTFALYAADKIKAVRGKWRIRESVLLFVAFIGGSAGALLGMFALRHKIRKWYFTVFNPLMFVLHLAAGIALYLNAVR